MYYVFTNVTDAPWSIRHFSEERRLECKQPNGEATRCIYHPKSLVPTYVFGYSDLTVNQKCISSIFNDNAAGT